jgi:hypothetical protein
VTYSGVAPTHPGRGEGDRYRPIRPTELRRSQDPMGGAEASVGEDGDLAPWAVRDAIVPGTPPSSPHEPGRARSQTCKYARADSTVGVRCDQKVSRARSVRSASRIRPHSFHRACHRIQYTSATSNAPLRSIRIVKAIWNTGTSSNATRTVPTQWSSMAKVASRLPQAAIVTPQPTGQ